MMMNVFKRKKTGGALDSLTAREKAKLEELIFEEEKKGEKRVNKITFVISAVILLIVFIIVILFGIQPNFEADVIVIGLFFLYNLILFIILKKDIYYRFFKYMTVTVTVTAIIFLLYLYSVTSGWLHATRTVTITVFFLVICLSGYYQRPRLPVYTAVLSSCGYLIIYFYTVFFTDIPVVVIENYKEPVLSWDLAIMYPGFFLITGGIVSTITRRLQIILGRSIHYEAEAFFRKETEETNRKLKELDHFKTLFFQNITHEFRTPLTLILGPLDSLLSSDSASVSGTVRGRLEVIQRNAKRLLYLVNQLLDLARIESGKMTLRVRETDIVEFLRRIVSVYHSFAAGKNIDLSLTTDREACLLFIDTEKIEKVINNLLSNAFKFVKSGGRITVSVSGPVGVSSAIGKDSYRQSGIEDVVVIKVRDTGIGIPEDQLESIFDRFRQVDGSSTRDAEGTGIGLSLVKEYVGLHHGAIEVTSELESFTEFSVYLPAGKTHLKKEEIITGDDGETLPDNDAVLPLEAKRTIHTGREGAGGKGTAPGQEKVLVVEDNDDMRQYISEILKDTYALYEAKNGEEAMASVSAVVPDLIISDVMMPKMDGNQLIAALRKNEKTKKIPVILLTAQTSEEYKIKKLIEGVDDYISKPFNPRELQARVAILLKAREYERIIVNSITYTSRIQRSILPGESTLDRYIRHFSIWKPRDIVSGDIYWFKSFSDTEFLVAVIDCTGHGVPGAVMTMTANSVLNRIADDYVHDDPSAILGNLNILMRETLKQNTPHPLSDDGLDIALCYADTKKEKLVFAGARLSLLYFQNGILQEIKGDRQSIGYVRSREDYRYANHDVPLDGETCYYLATDGYYEQNSPGSTIPMGRQRFFGYLKSCAVMSLDDQKVFLEKSLSDFERDAPQRDDITVIGFRFT